MVIEATVVRITLALNLANGDYLAGLMMLVKMLELPLISLGSAMSRQG